LLGGVGEGDGELSAGGGGFEVFGLWRGMGGISVCCGGEERGGRETRGYPRSNHRS
jgi:hypothetical protein